jgi:hypothetical protein
MYLYLAGSAAKFVGIAPDAAQVVRVRLAIIGFWTSQTTHMLCAANSSGRAHHVQRRKRQGGATFLERVFIPRSQSL